MAGMSITKGLRLSRLAVLLLGAAVLPLRAQELPTAPQVVAGDVTVNAAPGRVEVGQGSAYGIVDWGGFGIGAGGAVHFDNGAGATLNRVTGGMGSQIDGSLTASGSVFLVNPAGIVVGASGVVDTGGRFVASTLDVANSDFLDGGDLTFSGAGGVVVNLGQVGSSGGDVALIAGDVLNAGTLTAPNGTVGLVAGRQVLMRDAAVDDGMFSVLMGAGDVTDTGAIKAAAAELRARGGNVYALAGNTDAVIEAKGVEKVKGRIFLTAPGGKVKATKAAKASESLTVTGGDIDVSGALEAPKVVVKADEETSFTGMIQTGADGFVELSGGHITFDGAIDVGGGTILIDPRNIEITDNNSGLLADATMFNSTQIGAFLASGNLILDTTTGANGAAGTILISTGIHYTSDSDLTLLAAGDILVRADLQNSGSGDVTAVAGWDGVTAFDAASFGAADLETTGIFGRSTGASYSISGADLTTTGSVRVSQASANFGAAFGSKTGATRAYGREIEVTGGTSAISFSSNPYAQLGFHTTGGGDFGLVAGEITARATGDIWVTAGSGGSAYALIGHGGNELGVAVDTPTADISGDITVEAAGDLTLIGSAGTGTDGAYAMIGHGSQDFARVRTRGDRFGAIKLAVGEELTLQDGGNFTNDVWIGHATGGGTISGAPVTVTTARMDDDATASVPADGQSFADVAMWADNTHAGEVRLIVTGSDLLLTGSTEFIDTEGSSITSPFDLVVRSGLRLTLDSEFFYGNDGVGGLVLVGSSVENQAQSGAFLDIGGGWHIYSTRPEDDLGLIGTLEPDYIGYAVSYNDAGPRGPHEALGSGIYYAVVPVIEVDAATITYGDDVIPGTVRLLVGGVAVDAADYGLTLTREIDPDLPLSADDFINAGVYSNALYSSEVATGALQILGYVRNEADLTVNRAVVTVTLADETKTYDGLGKYSGAVSFDGFLGSDGLVVATGLGFTYAGGDGSGVNAGTYVVRGQNATEPSGNYVFDYSDTAQLVIQPRALTVGLFGPPGCYELGGCNVVGSPQSINNANCDIGPCVGPQHPMAPYFYFTQCGLYSCQFEKFYDGTDQALVLGGYVFVEGEVGSEVVSLGQAITGRFSSANAGVRSVTVDLSDPAIWSFAGGAQASNYILPSAASGFGQIYRRPLTVAIDGTVTKPFDGTTPVSLAGQSLRVSGLAPGESVTVNVASADFSSALPGSGTLSAPLTSANLVAGPGTDLSNYLVFSVEGTGVIVDETPATPTEPQAVSFTPEIENGEIEPPSLNGALEVINTETTAQILEEIQAGTSFCREFVDPQYAIDCLSDRLQSVADGLSAKGEYSEVRAALEDAAAQLHALAVQNASAALSRSVARASDGSGRTSSRPLTAVDPARLADVNAQAAAIIANTQLVLLRSTGNSERRRVAFSQVGQVLGATTVLLRS